MKLAFVVAVALAGLAFVSSASSSQSSQASLTVVALGIHNMPVGSSPAYMAYGPFWNFQNGPRPGQGKAMVIGGHDVTPVPGYGQHGPFYNLVTLKKGYLIGIRWHGKLYQYRLVHNPKWHPESDDYVVNQVDGVESIWIYSCWPRYTHNGRLWAEAVLVKSTKK